MDHSDSDTSTQLFHGVSSNLQPRVLGPKHLSSLNSLFESKLLWRTRPVLYAFTKIELTAFRKDISSSAIRYLSILPPSERRKLQLRNQAIQHHFFAVRTRDGLKGL